MSVPQGGEAQEAVLAFAVPLTHMDAMQTAAFAQRGASLALL